MKERDDNGNSFEEQWQSALDQLSVAPPKKVWVELDRALANAELISVKQKIGVYKWSAAAAVFFGLIAGAIAFTDQFKINFGTNYENLLITQRNEMLADASSEANGNYNGFSILGTGSTTLGSERSSNASSNQAFNRVSYRSTNYTPPLFTAGIGIDSSNGTGSLREFISINYLKPDVSFKKRTVPENYYVQKIPTYAYMSKPRKSRDVIKQSSGKFWAGFDIASGYYDPRYNQSSSNSIASTLVQKGNADGRRQELVPELSETMRGGASYALGLNLGVNVKDRWTIESGVNYSILGARTLTNLILESESFNKAVAFSSEISGIRTVAEIAEDGLTQLSVDDIDLNNTFQFVSLPLQAGYIILDQKLSLKLNAGVAANLYLGNKITGTNDLSTFQIEPGSSSPYKDLSIAGLAGLELGYRIFERITVSVEPNYQQSLGSLTKNSSNFVTTPIGIGLQTGLKYSF